MHCHDRFIVTVTDLLHRLGENSELTIRSSDKGRAVSMTLSKGQDHALHYVSILELKQSKLPLVDEILNNLVHNVQQAYL